MYYSVLQQALTQLEIPWHISVFIRSTRFLAIPETVLSPQILLLNYLTIGAFVMINTMTMYSVGFIGLLLIRVRYKLALFPFTAMFLLFSFNGYIVAHLSLGHSMWNGYFLLPFFFLYLFELIDTPSNPWPSVLKIALSLFAILLQGSYHIFVITLFFLGLFSLLNWRHFMHGSVAIGLSLLLSVGRLFPAMIAFQGNQFQFGTGFPTIYDMFESLVTIRLNNFPSMIVIWGEYDMFIGLIALGFLLYIGVYWRCLKKSAPPLTTYPCLDIPLFSMSLFCLNYFYFFINRLPIPLLNAERTPIRFFIIPLLLLIILSVIHLNKMLPSLYLSGKKKLFLGICLLETGLTLMAHSRVWKVSEAEKFVPLNTHSLLIHICSQAGDDLYKTATILGWSLSLCVLIAILVYLLFIPARR